MPRSRHFLHEVSSGRRMNSTSDWICLLYTLKTQMSIISSFPAWHGHSVHAQEGHLKQQWHCHSWLEFLRRNSYGSTSLQESLEKEDRQQRVSIQLLCKRQWSDTWYITVVSADPCPEYGNDESITPNGKTVWVPGGSVVVCFRCIPLWVNGNEPNNNSPIEKAFDNDRERYDGGLEVRVFVLVKLWGKIKRIGGRRVFWIGMIVSKEPNKRLQYTVLHLI